MSRVHVPVLAGELIDLTAPAPGETAVDCTFGAGGHARLVADRLGPTGTLVCIDRDPAAQRHFDELAAEVACETRFLRMDYADGLALLAEEGLEADIAYLDLGISSMQVDARERGFSYSYDAPLDMRMDPAQELDARAVVNEWDERRAGRGDRGGPAGGGAAELRRWPPGEARLPGRADRGERRARLARPRAAAGLEPAQGRRSPRGDRLPFARGPAREALPGRAGARVHLPARLPGLRVRARARGGAVDRPRRGADARGGGEQSAGEVRTPARRPQAGRRRGRLMGRAATARATAPRTKPAKGRTAPPRARSARHAAPSRITAPARRVSG